MVYYVIKGKQKIETASGDHVVETKWRRLGDIAKCTETVCAGPGGHSENLEAQKYFSGLMGLLHPSLVYTVSLYIILYIIYELVKVYLHCLHPQLSVCKGLPTKDETSEMIVQNLFNLFSCIQGSL